MKYEEFPFFTSDNVILLHVQYLSLILSVFNLQSYIWYLSRLSNIIALNWDSFVLLLRHVDLLWWFLTALIFAEINMSFSSISKQHWFASRFLCIISKESWRATLRCREPPNANTKLEETQRWRRNWPTRRFITSRCDWWHGGPSGKTKLYLPLLSITGPCSDNSVGHLGNLHTCGGCKLGLNTWVSAALMAAYFRPLLDGGPGTL